MNGFYQNSGYVNKRNRKQILILDVSDEGGETFLGAGTEFSVDLFEPLIIDSLSEVYLDNFITYNSNISTFDDMAFVFKINEFNINSNVASSNDNNTIFNSLLIPNEHTSPDNNQSMIIQKAKKFNYVCDINPGKISNISGKITNLAGGPIFHGSSTTATHTYTLTGIDQTMTPTYNDIWPLQPGDAITALTVNSEPSLATSVTGVILAHANANTNDLHFSYGPITDTELAYFNGDENDITFAITRTSPSLGPTTITLSNDSSSTENPNLSLRRGSGRFIAEFSINSRE